ncbi:MAG: glucuronate isomerase, partial [Acidobacteria bacterium]|nr:glucuronate isomerase [Acidobacteriota bacterium]
MTDQDRSSGHTLTRLEDVRRETARIVADTGIFDMHTHLFPPAFGGLSRWGIDNLLTYHYLVAEVMRATDVSPEQFRQMPQSAQADLIWDALFVRSTPLSEATRGVVRVLSALGVDPAQRDLRQAREFFRDTTAEAQVDLVFERAGVSAVVMTNDPFDRTESEMWRKGRPADSRFKAALRIDPLLNEWDAARQTLSAAGYAVSAQVDNRSVAEARRFIDQWIERMDPLYLAVSLPDDFVWPEDSPRGQLIEHVVLPVCRDHRLPFAMMVGVRRAVNPALGDAGDGVGRADVSAIQRLCRLHPSNRFLVTMLSRENQHELCVAARKFANLMPFGCWWFLNNPSIVSEITRERLELLGPTFVPQHSDARILEQLLYKWPHSRRNIADALADQYAGVVQNGRPVSTAEIACDVSRLFSDN